MPSSRGLSASLLLYRVQEVKPKVFAWIPDDVIDQECDPLFTRAATAGFIVTAEGVVVVDTANSPMHARDLLYEIRRAHRPPHPLRHQHQFGGRPHAGQRSFQRRSKPR